MDKQVIVSISREFCSGGHQIGEAVAKALGLGFCDRNMLDEIAQRKNIRIEYLEKYDEKPRNLLLSRRVGAFSNSIEDIIAEMQFEYLRDRAASGESFVVVGRCADSVLRGRKCLIPVFVMGDERDISIDSRSSEVGCVATDNIAGIIDLRVWPLGGFGVPGANASGN